MGNPRKEIGPVSMNFEIPMYNVSNLQVRYLRISETHKSYNPYRYVAGRKGLWLTGKSFAPTASRLFHDVADSVCLDFVVCVRLQVGKIRDTGQLVRV